MVSIKWCCRQKEGIKLIESNDNLSQGYLKMAENSLGTMNREKRYNLMFSISAWVYYYGKTGVNQDHAKILLKPHSSIADPWNMFSLGLDNAAVGSQNAKFEISTGSSGGHLLIESTSIIPTNQWVHIAAVYDNTNMHIYINGIDENQNPTTIIVGTNNQPLQIGGWASNPDNNRWHGLVDDVRIYNYALSATEIQYIYSQVGSMCGPADTDISGDVSMVELISYVASWKAGTVNMIDLMTGIGEWKNGC